MSWPLLQNSLLVSSAAMLGALFCGCLGALALATLPKPWRHLCLGASIVAMAFPPFLVTSCWLHLLGQAGVWRAWVPFSIFSAGGTAWVLILLTWPLTLLLVSSAWQGLEASQLESDPAVRGGSLLRFVLWPMARPALGLAAVLTFVLAFNNFAVPALLQTKVFPAELWVSFNTTFNYAEALQLSWPLLAIPALLLLWMHRHPVRWPRLTGSMSSTLFRQRLGRPWTCFALGGTGLLLFFSVALPLSDLVMSRRTWMELPGALAAGHGALWNSLFLAALAAFIACALSLLSWRFRWITFFWIPFFVPGVLVGITLIFIFNRPFTSLLYQSFGIVLLGLAIRYGVLGWTAVRHAMQSVDPDLTAAGQLAGASAWQLFRHVHWPQIAPAIGAIWYITYLLCLWDVETLVLIAPPGGETLSLRVFNLLHYGHNTQVNALCLLLLALAVAPLAGWRLGWIFVNRLRTLPFRGQARAVVAAAIVVAGTGCGPGPANAARVESRFFSHVQIIGSWGTALGQFNKPRSVTVDAADNLYVADMTGRVQKFSPSGIYLAYWQMPQTDLGKPKGLCRDARGNIIVLEPHYQRVNHFTPDGQLLGQWGRRGTNAGELTLPRAVAVNSRGEIFISEYTTVDRVQQFTSDGMQYLNAFGRPGIREGEFNRAEGLGIDAADRLYVADSCNHRVQVFSGAGQFIRSYGRPGAGPGEMSYPYDVQIDAAGYQFVCEFGNSRVQIFDAGGQSVEILGAAGSAPGQFNNPWSLALDSRGHLYVADSRNHRVQKFIRKPPVVSAQRRAPLALNGAPSAADLTQGPPGFGR